VALLRAEPAVFGAVASDPTVSRTIDILAADAPAALKAIDTARAAARSTVWRLAGPHPPNRDVSAEAPLIIDTDATLITAHSDKGAGGADVQTRLWVPSVVGLRRSRRRGHR
jgi:hypothetical protein